MSVGIECPVCEAVFRVKQVSSKTGIRCPKCDRKFRYSKEFLATSETSNEASDLTDAKSTKLKTEKHTTSKPTATDSAPHDKQNRQQKSKPVAPATTPPKPTQDNHQSAAAASQSKVATDQHSTEALPSQSSEKIDVEPNTSSKMTLIQARKRQKTRQQTSRAITSIVILSIAIAILGYFLYQQLNYTPPVEQTVSNIDPASKKERIDFSQLDPDFSEPQWKDSGRGPLENNTANSDEPDEDDQLIELPRVSVDDLPEREFEYLQRKEIRTVWQRIRPRLISLEVRTDLGTSPSVGTIVDSRGWALTSNQLVSKWPDVMATASARDIDDYYVHIDAKKEGTESSLLADLSKGIASVHPTRDQTLIELNSRFVVALDTLEFARRLDIVSGMYLVQAAPPSPTNPYGCEEVNVHGRQEFEELETEARDKAKALGIDDPSATWVVTSKKALPVIGTPVLTRTGKLVATYAFSTKQFAYFIMVDQTKALITKAAASSADGGKLKVVDATVDLLSPDHSMASPSQLMNRAGIACESFGWIPADEDQYLQLQKFSRRFSKVNNFVQDHQDDESESVTLGILSDHIKRWQRSLSASIRNVKKVSPQKINQLNAIAVDKLSARRPNTANTFIPFVSEVYSAGFDITENRDSVLMTINEDQAIIKVEYSPEAVPMPPGSQFLCFYKRPLTFSQKHLTLNSGAIVPTYTDGRILTVLGPIRNR